MAKIDKSKFTKEEIKQLFRKKQVEKNEKRKLKYDIQPLPTKPPEYNVLCLKHGTKYGSNYVNTLYSMVTKNLDLPFKFFCLTEDPTDLHANINILPLPKLNRASGWWYKPYIFSKDIPINGTILYLDLDIVITSKIDRLFNFYPGKYCILRDFTRAMRPSWEKYNSSVIKFEKGNLSHVWEKFQKEHTTIVRKFFGDQDYLYDETKDTATYFPDKWILSWKWEVRRNKQFANGGTKGNRKFAVIENVRAPEDCCIAVFHGDPNPHNCEDPYIIEKWK